MPVSKGRGVASITPRSKARYSSEDGMPVGEPPSSCRARASMELVDAQTLPLMSAAELMGALRL